MYIDLSTNETESDRISLSPLLNQMHSPSHHHRQLVCMVNFLICHCLFAGIGKNTHHWSLWWIRTSIYVLYYLLYVHISMTGWIKINGVSCHVISVPNRSFKSACSYIAKLHNGSWVPNYVALYQPLLQQCPNLCAFSAMVPGTVQCRTDIRGKGLPGLSLETGLYIVFNHQHMNAYCMTCRYYSTMQCVPCTSVRNAVV